MRKRVKALLLVGVLALSAFTGCGKKENKKEVQAQDKSEHHLHHMQRYLRRQSQSLKHRATILR